MKVLSKVVPAILLVLCTLLQATEENRGSYVIFQLDNDLFTGSDNDYTNGARFAVMRPVPADSLNDAQKVLKKMTGVDGRGLFSTLGSLVEDDSIRYDYGMGLTQLMFTPDDPDVLSSGPGQRPYAGWLGAEISLHAKNQDALSSAVFSLGITGKYSYAQETQNWVHKNISDSPIFQGWDSQIPTEVTVNLMFDRKRRLASLEDSTKDWPIQMDGYLEWGAMLGNGMTEAHVGGMVRAGFNLPPQFMVPELQMGNFPHELFDRRHRRWKDFSLYVFGGAFGSGILHNITLDGPLFTDFETGTSSEPWVGEVLAGAAVRIKSITMAVSRTFRSREFVGQQYNHQFGSVLVSIAF